MRRISARRFDALCYVRAPHMHLMAREVRHYESQDRTNLAIVVLDYTDRDFGFIILGRDSRELFRAIEVSSDWFPNPDLAEEALSLAIQKYEGDGQACYPQDDETGSPHNIYEPRVSPEKQHQYFKVLVEEPRMEAARRIIQEIAFSFVDVDGNYIEQFQSTAFDQRLWELFLYVLFHKELFEIDNTQSAPDFHLKKFGEELFVEAVTVGANPDFDVVADTPAMVAELSKDYAPIKFGSALFSKINRKRQYWELPHVAGKPFVLAVHDYHGLADGLNLGSMTWTRAGLVNYLYGVRDEVETRDGEIVGPKMIVGRSGLEPARRKIHEHRFKHKVIPSRFFDQPNAENVSGVLFSNGATITTFNRMGKISGLGGADVKMIRTGIWVGDDGVTTFPFAEDVDGEDYDEAWGDTVTLFHNPRAKHPIDPDLFPEIGHAVFDPIAFEVKYSLPPKHVMSSSTMVIAPTPNENEAPAANDP